MHRCRVANRIAPVLLFIGRPSVPKLFSQSWEAKHAKHNRTRRTPLTLASHAISSGRRLLSSLNQPHGKSRLTTSACWHEHCFPPQVSLMILFFHSLLSFPYS